MGASDKLLSKRCAAADADSTATDIVRAAGTESNGGVAAATHHDQQYADAYLDGEELTAVTRARRASEDADNLIRQISKSSTEGAEPVFTKAAREIDLLLGQLDQHIPDTKPGRKLIKRIRNTQRIIRASGPKSDRWRKKTTQTVLESIRKINTCQGKLLQLLYAMRNSEIRVMHQTSTQESTTDTKKTSEANNNVPYRLSDITHVKPLCAVLASPFLNLPQ